MPPVRRRPAPRSSAAALCPRRTVWPARPTVWATRGRRWDDRRRADDRLDVTINGTVLTDDALAAVFSRLPGVADVVRCAATCRRWGRLVADRGRALARALPPTGRPLPRLALGVFHQENDAPTARTRRSAAAAAAAPPRFAPMESAAALRPLIGSHGDHGIFRNSLPVASRNGRLVLELQREAHADGLRLCVCDPLSGDAAMLPALSGGEKPRDYRCAVLTGDDLDPRPRSLASFRVLLLYTRRGLTALRCYSSDAGRWGPEADAGVRVSGWKLRQIGPAVVRRGVAFWPLDHGALGVRVSAGAAAAPEITETHLVPYLPHYWPAVRLLGVRPDDERLFFVHFGVCWLGYLLARVAYFEIDGDDLRSGRKLRCTTEDTIPMPQLRVRCQDMDTLKLRWVCERSGVLLFTLGESSGCSGTFALNLWDRVLEKVADGEGDAWRNFVGYEMGMASYLAAIAP
ncbi:hypothetical protein ACP4OV_020985 [Aristida adscensionis]